MGESATTDEHYEGCLSFFDVRGMVPRPTVIEVEHQDVDGRTLISEFDGAEARLVGHEVDHLFGVLYRSRMRPGVEPIPVAQYTGDGCAVVRELDDPPSHEGPTCRWWMRRRAGLVLAVDTASAHLIRSYEMSRAIRRAGRG